jgi:hypothetical protein
MAAKEYWRDRLAWVAFGKIPASRNTGEKRGTHYFPKCGDGVLQARAIAPSIGGTRRSERARLAEGKVAPQDHESGVGEGVG